MQSLETKSSRPRPKSFEIRDFKKRVSRRVSRPRPSLEIPSLVFTSKLATESCFDANYYPPLLQLLVRWRDVSPDWVCVQWRLGVERHALTMKKTLIDASVPANPRLLTKNRKVIQTWKSTTTNHNIIRSQKHELLMEETNKIVLSANDDKRNILPDKVHTHAHGFSDSGGALSKQRPQSTRAWGNWQAEPGEQRSRLTMDRGTRGTVGGIEATGADSGNRGRLGQQG